MEINNKSTIREYLKKHLLDNCDDQYIKFEAIIRSKDKDNPLMKDHKGSFLIHSWIIQSVEKFDKHIDSMILLCKLTGARLYMSTDVKEVKKTALCLFDYSNELLKSMTRKNQISIKNIFNVMNSITSKNEVAVHEGRMILLDVDTDAISSESIVSELEMCCPEMKSFITVVPTVSGFHIIFPRHFLHAVEEFINLNKDGCFDVKQNALTLVYYNTEY